MKKFLTIFRMMMLGALIMPLVSCEKEGTEGSTLSDSMSIDLGLSVKWATCNVGASSPEEYGGYYAWGETEEKSNYDWSTYKWYNGQNGSDVLLKKYNNSSRFGTVDNKINLDPEDDVAHVKWGGDWRMPTVDEMRELLEKCTWEWASVNGVKGYNVTGPNGNSIFLPAAGYREENEVYGHGSYGAYWVGMLFEGWPEEAHMFDMSYEYYEEDDEEEFDWSWYTAERYMGYSVRPVMEK